MDKEQKGILIAMVIGDGYIEKRGNGKKKALKLCHSKAQEEYLEYKVDLLHSILGGKRMNITQHMHKIGEKRYPQVRAEKAHRYFRVLRNWLYPKEDNVKYFKFFTPKALAILYMDDGSIVANNRYKDGTCSSSRTRIHTCCSKEDANAICKYFIDTWGIKFTSFKEKANYSIGCYHKEGKKFHALIHDYIIPCMAYKQRFYYDTSAQPLSKG